MKSKLILTLAILGLLTIALTCGYFLCKGKTASTQTSSVALAQTAYSGETVTKKYYIKGMTCAGCVFGVKKALQRLHLNEFVKGSSGVTYDKPDPDNQIGSALIEFPVEVYKGTETDCAIVREIKDNPGYVVFWDKKLLKDPKNVHSPAECKS